MTTPHEFPPPPSGPGADATQNPYGTPSSSYGAAPTGYPAAPSGYPAAPPAGNDITPAGYGAYPVAAGSYNGAVQNGPSGLTRSPITVFLLPFVTFGIYSLVWYYKINVELKNFNQSIQVNPVNMILLVLFVPFFSIFSIFYTGQRIQQAQAAAGLPASTSPGIGVLLALVIGGHSFYYQDALNNLWQYRQA